MCAPVLTMSTQEGSWICCYCCCFWGGRGGRGRGEREKKEERVRERGEDDERGGARLFFFSLRLNASVALRSLSLAEISPLVIVSDHNRARTAEKESSSPLELRDREGGRRWQKASERCLFSLDRRPSKKTRRAVFGSSPPRSWACGGLRCRRAALWAIDPAREKGLARSRASRQTSLSPNALDRGRESDARQRPLGSAAALSATPQLFAISPDAETASIPQRRWERKTTALGARERVPLPHDERSTTTAAATVVRSPP